MARWWVLGGVVVAAGLGLWLWPGPGSEVREDAAPAPAEAEARPTRRALRPPVAGAECVVRGIVEGGRAAKVSLHSIRAGADVPAKVVSEGRRFEGALPEQGEIEAVVQAADGRSASVREVCDGSGLLELTVRLPAEKGPAASLSGRCVYLETGVAVAEARVVGRWADERGEAAFAALTDDEGRFEVAAPAGAYRVRCGKDGDESEAARVTVEPGVPARLELFLAARAGVTGTVRGPEGPVAGLEVRGRPAREGVDGREVRGVTDEEGRYLLMGLPPGPVVVDAQDEGRFAEGQGVARVDLPYAEVDLLLAESEVVLEGFVTADGAVEGATVEVTQIRGRRGWPRARSRRAVRTGPDGGYAVGGLTPGRYRVAASAPGRVEARAEVTLVPGRTRVDLRLEPACETTIVVGPDAPSRPVFVRVHMEGVPDVRASGRTGAPIVVSAKAGPAEVYARSVGQAVATATVGATLCAGPVRLDLAAKAGRGTLEVRTIGPGGTPVAGVRVWVNTPGGLAVTPADGLVRFEGLEPKSYRVGTRDAEPVDVEVEADSVATVELEVRRADGDVRGVVVAGAAPVEGAAILAACADSGRSPGLSDARVRARSDAEGNFSFVPDDGGLCLVRAEHRSDGRSEPVLLRAGGEPGTLALLGSASLAGRVLRAEDRAPVTRYTLSVRSLGSAASIEGRTLQISSPDGAFEVPDVAPGRVSLLVTGSAGKVRQELELGPGERRTGLELLVFGQGRVVGRVVDEDGAPVARAKVRVEASRRPLGRSMTGPDGAFGFSVPAGDPLRVYVSAEGYYPRGTETFDLRPGGPTDVGDVVLQARGGPEEKEGGIGIMFGGEADGIRIIRFTDDSPAREAGLRVGDLITAIDGVPFGRDPLVNWVVTLRGVAGTPVVLQIRRGSQSPFTATVVRRAIGLGAVPQDAP